MEHETPASMASEAHAPIDRRPFSFGEEMILALLPTATILLVLTAVEAIAEQRLLFASLASSAFLIYADPGHTINRVRSLLLGHGIAASVGLGVDVFIGNGYAPAAISMVITILLILAADAVHPPAISTALSFAFRPGEADRWILFMIALGIIAVLAILQPLTAAVLARLVRRREQTRNGRSAPLS